MTERQQYTEARGECGELATTVDLLSVFGLATQPDCEAVLARADQVGRMLTSLARRFN